MTVLKKPPIYIPIETKVREFDGKLLLATHCLEKGHEVFIGSRYHINNQLLMSRNGIYLPKSISLELKDFYRQFKERNHKIFLLHAEGGVLHKEISESIKYSYPKELIQYLDKIFVYGSAIKEAILKYVPNVTKEMLTISGEPRFDLLKPRFNRFLQKDISAITEKFGDFILINTSFGLSNHLISDEYANNLIKNNPDFSDQLKDILFRKKKAFKNVFLAFKEVAKQLALAYPQINIVLRPHPEENPQPYIDHFDQIPNIFVEKKGNVAFWIRAAKMVIHYDCTTGVETYMTGKPVLAFVPEKEEELVAWLPIFLSEEINDSDLLIRRIGEYIKNDFKSNGVQSAEKNNTLKKYIANIELETSKICKELLPATLNGKATPFNEKIGDLKNKLYHFSRNTAIDQYRNLKEEKKTTASDKLGKMTAEEVKRKLGLLSEIENLNIDFRVKELHKNLIKITPV